MMSKAVLILDEMPENCRECQFEDQDDFRRKNICNATASDRVISDFDDEIDEDERPDWCPLQEPVIYKDIEKYEKDEYKGGWNDAMYQIGAVTMEEACPWMKEEFND